MQRRRLPPEQRIHEPRAAEASRFKEAAEELPPGSHARELLLRRARQAETALQINNWLTSPGLQPPAALENLSGTRRDDGSKGF